MTPASPTARANYVDLYLDVHQAEVEVAFEFHALVGQHQTWLHPVAAKKDSKSEGLMT